MPIPTLTSNTYSHQLGVYGFTFVQCVFQYQICLPWTLSVSMRARVLSTPPSHASSTWHVTGALTFAQARNSRPTPMMKAGAHKTRL